ncbi:MAG: hydrogenase subunit MbhD domain-containing protein [Desulfohalobiaceae bacterium]
MELTGTILDCSLALTLVVLSFRILQSSDLFQAVVLFITFGLVMALTWVRLEAPDIALTEAAVGAGLAGVLLLDSLRRMGRRRETPAPADKPAPAPGRESSHLSRTHFFGASAATLALAGMLVAALFVLPDDTGDLARLVRDNLPKSGLEHPVSAVLLNFRAYDTWLELGVLVLAFLGILGIRECPGLKSIQPPPPPPLLLQHLVGGLFPLVALSSGYLLWSGSFAPGGAFQSGVVLGAGFILLWMAGYPSLTLLTNKMWLVLVVFGFTSFLLVGTFSLVLGLPFLTYHPGYAKPCILALELAATLSIGIIMAGLVLALQPMKEKASCEIEE